MSNILKVFSKNKTGAIAIAILLVLSLSTSFMLIPTTKAQTPGETIPTYAYINVSPNPVGTGQSVEVIIWLNQVIFNAAIPNSIRFHNYQLVITAPNGDKITQTFAVVADSTSAQDYAFTPDQVGTYSLNFTFPGQTYNFPITFTMFGSNAPYEGDYYAPSSALTTLTVQQAPISYYPTTPLPTSYWTRPIYGYNTNWVSVSSNWLGTGAPGYGGFASTYNAGGNGEQLAGAGDVVGSMTGHVMWTKPLDSGGVVGGNQTAIVGDTYFEGSAYNQRYNNPIIVDGMLFYTEPISFAGVAGGLSGSAYGPTDCVNLQTGQLIWSRSNVPALSFAYVYDVQDPNQHGVYQPILFAASGGASLFGVFPLVWEAFDAFTGDPMFNVTNVPVGSSLLGPNGEELVVSLTNYGTLAKPNYYLQEWNSSRLWDGDYSGESTSPPVIPPITNGADPSLLDFNVSVTGVPSGVVTQIGAILDDSLLCYTGNLPSTGAIFMGSQSDTPYTYFTVSISESHKTLGSILWKQTYNPPANNITVLEAGIDPINRVFVENWRETSQYVGYSLDTGQKVWGPTVAQADLDYYGSPASGSLANAFAYGKMYSSAYAGIVYCYDTKTGNLLWTYGNGGEGNSTNSGLETPFAHYPTFVNAIGNDVVYLVTTEHTPETPLFKGGLARAINATTGKEIWTLSEYTGEFQVFSYAAADGYNTWFNGYDAQIYVVGRGPSQTTVTAPGAGLASGQPVVIRGTVTDVSAGTKENEQASDFPNGVPVSSDASMREWMGYVYQQQPEPTNFTGVPVAIYVTDSNNNYRQIGTATTNSHGMYTLTWTPDIAGNYTVYANFAGTNGYWPSSDTTSFTVMQAAATAAPTATPLSGVATQTTLEYIGIAIIIVIIIIGAVLAFLVTRKHP
ncbi:MAG: PQQ-binding-like beta-propeller repeat protein [Candidatus Bathyarchaeia archaeon]|jgi:hypothetical protein